MRTKHIITFLFFIITSIGFSQEIQSLKTGFITITTNQRLKFKNLRTEGIEVVFHNIKTSSDYRYLKNTIKKIEDDSLNVVYVNPKFEDEPNIREKKVAKEDIFYKHNSPDGIYYTKEDFIQNNLATDKAIIAKDLDGLDSDAMILVENNCFFHFKADEKKIRNAFAVSYNGYLYFQIKAILSNRNKTDRAQKNDYPNSFVRVFIGGTNYLYTEAPLVNLWEEAFTYAATSNYALTESLTNAKGLVWDFKKQEFNIFKNCADYKNFIIAVLPEKTIECESSEADVKEIRKDILLIK
jgi:hypothetical protein